VGKPKSANLNSTGIFLPPGPTRCILNSVGYRSTNLEVTAHAEARGPVAERVRKARRLRALLWKKPHKLHTELRKLSTQEVAAALVDRPGFDEPAREFSRLAANAMEGDVLRYSSRLELMAHASRLGIEPFEANLLIAMVRNKAQDQMELQRKLSSPKQRAEKGRMVLAFLLMEAAAILGTWWVLARVWQVL
jgi:hypothetical protein